MYQPCCRSLLIGHTKAAGARRRGPTREETQENRFKRAEKACRHSGRVKDAARALLAEQRSPGNDATWERLKAKYPDEDPGTVELAMAEAISESSRDGKEGSAQG